MEVRMLRISTGFFALALLVGGTSAPAKPFAWPHRIIIQSNTGRTVSFRVFTIGGELPITVDKQGRFTQVVTGMPSIKRLTEKDTVHAVTPGDFYVDVGKGPIVVIADDSVRVIAGFNPFGGLNKVWADGRRLTVKLVDGLLVVEHK